MRRIAGEPLQTGRGLVPAGQEPVDLLGQRAELVPRRRHRQPLPRRERSGGDTQPVDRAQRRPGAQPRRAADDHRRPERPEHERGRRAGDQRGAADDVAGHDHEPGAAVREDGGLGHPAPQPVGSARDHRLPTRQLPHLRRAERERREAVDRLARRVDDPQVRSGELAGVAPAASWDTATSACRCSSASAAPTSADASTPTASRPNTTSTTAAATPTTTAIRARRVRPPTSAASAASQVAGRPGS